MQLGIFAFSGLEKRHHKSLRLCPSYMYTMNLLCLVKDINRFDSVIFRILLVLILVALGVFFGLDTAKQPERFISLAGLFANILLCWIFSKHRRKVSHVLFFVLPCVLIFCTHTYSIRKNICDVVSGKI